MVALAVFGLAALALLRLESTVIRGAATIDETVAAGIVAQNVAVTAITDPRAPALGVARGSEDNAGRSWTWTRGVTATGDPRVLRIEVRVANAGGQTVRRLTTIRADLGTGT